MNVLTLTNPKSDAAGVSLTALELGLDEGMPGLTEICRLAALFFRVPMAAIAWPRDGKPAILASYGVNENAATTLLELASPAPHNGTGAPAHRAETGPIGFYTAVPLELTAGTRQVGTFCIAGKEDRPFGAEELRHLRGFALVAAEALRGRKALIDVRQREHMLARASRLARVGGWEYDLLTEELTLSEQVYDIYGLDHGVKPTLDMMMRRFYPGSTLIDTREDFARLVREGKGYDSRRHIQRLDGSSRWIHVLAEPEIRDGKVVRVFGLIEDISDEVEAQRRFHELAYTDKLTGLPNRGAFLTRLARHFAGGRPLYLIAIDVDGFKDINDTIGHHAGDQLLAEIGRRLTVFFPVGTDISRVGSNEFTVIVDGAGARHDEIVEQVERLRRVLKEPVHCAEHTLAISVSIGLCGSPGHAADADQLVRSTDIALYQAKKAGGDRAVVFEPDMRDKLEERVQLLRDVRRGIEHREFILYYQPIYDMRSHTLAGFEALMRWSLPERGILAPAVFGAAFDDQTLAPLLGTQALHTAFAQMRSWADKGFDFGRVSVNVAAAQFYPADLAAQILAMLTQYGLRPGQLTLEITESVYLGSGADVVENALRALHDAGVHIALDDFGTGYASLSQLLRFPIDSLKIDKSFVQQPGARSIVDAIIALGKSLNLDIVAEGIETSTHQDQLLASGCRYGQGYYFGRPMPAEFYA